MKWRTLAAATVGAAAFQLLPAALATPLLAQSAGADSTVAGLPLYEAPTSLSGRQLVFLITGDGGYASGDRAIAETFAAHGMPVVSLNSRAYLGQKRLPDEVARDAARVMRHYLALWHRDSVVFVGYSRGADMAPFIVTRLPDELRSRLSLVAMIGLAERASFEFHWSDMVMNTKRSTDYPVAPEVMKVQGVHMLCLYGAREKDSLCPTFPPSVLHAEQHDGKHALSGSDGSGVAQRILRELDAGEAEHRAASPNS